MAKSWAAVVAIRDRKAALLCYHRGGAFCAEAGVWYRITGTAAAPAQPDAAAGGGHLGNGPEPAANPFRVYRKSV